MGRNYCLVDGCKNESKNNRELSFFRLPNESKRWKEWALVTGREDILSKDTKVSSYRVCSVHFEARMYRNKRLAPDAVPTLRLPGARATRAARVAPGTPGDHGTYIEIHVDIPATGAISAVPSVKSDAQVYKEIKNIVKNSPPALTIATQTDVRSYNDITTQTDYDENIKQIILAGRLMSTSIATQTDDVVVQEASQLQPNYESNSRKRKQLDNEQVDDNFQTVDDTTLPSKYIKQEPGIQIKQEHIEVFIKREITDSD